MLSLKPIMKQFNVDPQNLQRQTLTAQGTLGRGEVKRGPKRGVLKGPFRKPLFLNSGFFTFSPVPLPPYWRYLGQLETLFCWSVWRGLQMKHPGLWQHGATTKYTTCIPLKFWKAVRFLDNLWLRSPLKKTRALDSWKGENRVSGPRDTRNDKKKKKKKNYSENRKGLLSKH